MDTLVMIVLYILTGMMVAATVSVIHFLYDPADYWNDSVFIAAWTVFLWPIVATVGLGIVLPIFTTTELLVPWCKKVAEAIRTKWKK